MALSTDNAYTFKWRIENFSMCPQLSGIGIESPTFTIDFLEKTSWKLVLYPRARETGNEVSCYLQRTADCTFGGTVTIAYVLTGLFSSEKDLTEEIRSFKRGEFSSEMGNFREVIFNSSHGLLPMDTLTVTCRLRIVDVKKEASNRSYTIPYYELCDAVLQKEMFAAFARDELLNSRIQFSSNRCFVRSRVRVGKKCFVWPIRRIAALPEERNISIPVVITGLDGSMLFIVTLCLSGESIENRTAQIEIRRKEMDRPDIYLVKCEMTVLDGTKPIRFSKKDEHFFQNNVTNDVWQFPNFIPWNTLVSEKYFNSTQGVLYLRCEFTYASRSAICHLERIEFTPPQSQIPVVFKDEFSNTERMLRQLSKDNEFCDVILRVGDRQFKAPKFLLKAKSPVFTAMFDTNMKEKETSCVEIKDLEPDTVAQMLEFMYSETLENLNSDELAELYVASSKYQILTLKWHCSCHLKSILSIRNVCEILVLATTYRDDDLLHDVKNFIRYNSVEILNSQKWKDLMVSDGQLTGDIMHQLLTST